jgi:GDP-L-fucose synthase
MLCLGVIQRTTQALEGGAAARVCGILANATHPAEFSHDNLAIQTNVIHAAWVHRAKKLLFLGSSCIYPRLAPQPIKEEYLPTGPLGATNEAYAIAKIAGLKLAAAYHAQYGFSAITSRRSISTVRETISICGPRTCFPR